MARRLGSTFCRAPAKRAEARKPDMVSGSLPMQSEMAIPYYHSDPHYHSDPPVAALRLIACLACAVLLIFAGALPAAAAEAGVAQPRAVVVPGFWDPRRRPERPELSRVQTIRFLTELDYPPFDYAGPDGNPAGFNVDLARLLCDEIKATCTIQARRFDTLLDALNDNRGDAVIASIAPTAETRRRADFTDPYYRTPARFAARVDSPIGDVLPELLEGRKIAVIAGTAHEAYLKAMFTEAEVRPYPNAEAGRAALRNKEVDLLFGDGIALAFWLNGTDSGGCCAFRGGPFLESRFFGEGIGIAVKRGNDLLRQALNWALFRQWEKGSFTDLWLRYFPISPF
jgi:polar amino acid transport system substrate-binding protein